MKDEHSQAIADELGRRAKARQEHYDRNQLRRDQKREIEEAKAIEGDRSRRGLTQVSHFTVQHADQLKKQYGSDFFKDRDAIRHAAERDPSVASQYRQLIYGADAVRSNS